MKKGLFLCFVFIILIYFFCENYSYKTFNRTFMIYMNGSDLESEDKIASGDLKEICESEIPKGSKVLIYTGGTKNWNNEKINENNNQIFEIKNKKLHLVKNLPKKSMGGSETLSEFIDFSMKNYKSDENILVFWNHGGGAVSGFGKDENFDNDTLLLSELKKGLKTSYENHKTKLDMIVFDACLMSSLETAYTIKDYSKYMVASEEFVLGYGLNYKSIIEKSQNRDIESLGRLIVESYYKESVRKNKDKIITMSLLNLGKVESLYDKFNLLLENSINEKDVNNLKEDILKGTIFGGRTKEEGFSNMVDFLSLSKNIFKESDYENLEKLINEVVIYNRKGFLNNDACGVSIFFPLDYNNKTLNELVLYEKFNANNSYCKFLIKYSLNDDMKKNKDIFKVKKVQNKNIIYEITKYNQRSNNKPFYLNGYMLTCYKIGTIGMSEIYTSPIIYNGKEASIRFEYNVYNNKVGILGVVMGRGNLNISEKKLNELAFNDKICIINYELLRGGDVKILRKNALKVTENIKLLQM